MQEWEVELNKVCEAMKIKLELLRTGGVEYIQKNMSLPVQNDVELMDKISILKRAAQEVSKCQKCRLCETRTNTVYGVGNPHARLLFVGEGPGAEEDKQGIPFVGRAGQLLDKMIAAMNMTRDEVYICNVVKCRPPQNRDPEPDEIASCEPYLTEQLKVIKPEIMVGLGRYACQTLLNTKEPIAKLRGRWHEYNGIKFMPTFHPAYLLRNPPAKKEAWEDLKAVMVALNQEH